MTAQFGSADTDLAFDREYEPMTACTYCGCDVEVHDPVVVSEGLGADGDVTGQFCNYGCLAAHIERDGLATGTTCRVDL